jgi:hypothetical protein
LACPHRVKLRSSPPPSYAGTGGAIFVADFNGDGKPDILSADGTLNLGNGDGTFKLGTPVTGGVLAVADFNGDGIQDVLQQGVGTLLVLLGNGDGTFQAPVSTNSGASLVSVVAGDVNGDGKADVLGLYNNNLLVYLSNGNGTFAAGVPYAVGNSSNSPNTITLGDFNGDGKVDVAVSLSAGNAAGQEIVFLGNGDGTFQAGKTSTGVTYPTSVVAGDFNGDGKLDLVIAGLPCTGTCAYGVTSLMLGNGDGTFQAPTTIISNSGNLVTNDLNGDGKPDLVVQTAQEGELGVSAIVEIYLGNGDGTFSNTNSYVPVSPGSANALALADFNLDGKLDIAGAGTIFLGNGNGTFQGWSAVPLPPDGASAAVVGVFDNNGATGVAAISPNNANNLYILSNDGTGALSVAHTYTLQQPSYAIGVADINGDGNLDLVVEGQDPVSTNWSYSVLLGNGDGSFQLPVYYPQSSPGNSGSSVVIADFNGDGKPDLAFAVGNSSFAVLLGNGNGTFGTPAYFYDGGASSIVSADFNGDGKPDIAAASQNGLAILLGNGNGTFQPATFPFTTVSSNLIAVDLTGNGNVDLVSGNLVFLGNGNGTFTALTGALPASMGVGLFADINGDGKPDALGGMFNDDGYSSMGVALGNGDGTFGPYIVITPQQFGGPGSPAAAADMNGDGKQDLVVLSQNDGGVFTLINTTASVAGTTFSPAALSFPAQTVGSSSSATPVTLTNSGAVALTVTSVTLGGADAGEFTQTNNCTTVQPLASCAINVTFAPTAAGAVSANLIVADNAGTGSQMVVVSGTGTSSPDFTFGTASGSSSSTISAGQSATFNLSLAPSGSFSGTVNLTCNISPAASPAPICSVPGSVGVTGTSATSVMVTVGTTASGSVAGWPSHKFPTDTRLIGWTLALGLSTLLFVSRRSRPAVPAAIIVLAFLTMAACGGSSSTPPSSDSKGTPAGTYTAMVTATSGSLSHQVPLTVIVQ